jgi:hypothetical protein
LGRANRIHRWWRTVSPSNDDICNGKRRCARVTKVCVLLLDVKINVLLISVRSGVFIVLSTGLVFGTLLSGPATYYLMPKGEWNAIYISVWFQVLGVIITCFLPETLTNRKEQSGTNTPRGRHSTTSTLRSKSQELLVKLFTSLRQIFSSDTTVTLFVVSLLFIDVGEDIASIITKQYAAKRFQLTWPEVWTQNL